MADRATIADERVTVACPECDSAQVWFRRGGTDLGDADTLLRCGDCAAKFDVAILRRQKPAGGHTAKYEHLSPEDIGL